MVAIFANNATGKLGGDVTTSSTTLILQTGNGALFPSPTAGNYFPLTVLKADGTLEIMKCTSRANDVLTVARSQEGTTAKSFSIGDRVSLRITAKSLSDFVADKQPLDGTLTAISNMVVSADNIMYATGPDSFALTALTQFARSILDDADAASVLATIGAVSNSGLAGMVVAFAMQTAPSGFLKANGAAVSRTLYADLFAAIGTTFGDGDGSTTFNLPDLRGEFLRGFDDGRGVDSSRVFGTYQSDLVKSHRHAIAEGYDRTAPSGDSYVLDKEQFTIFGKGFSTSVPTYINTDHTSSYHSNTTYSGGTETRPRNIALLACIKY